MADRQDTAGWLMGIALGLVLSTVTAWVGGRGEPWDTSIYWSGAYPLALLLSSGLGFAFPQGSWRWALALMLGQVPVMLASGSGLGLLPLGLVMLAFLSLPAVLTARLGAELRWRAVG